MNYGNVMFPCYADNQDYGYFDGDAVDLELPDGTVKVLIEGIERVVIDSFITDAEYLKVDVKYFIDDSINEISFNNNNVLEEPGISYRKSEPLSQNDLLIKQKDDIIADMKYTIETLKKSLEIKDKMISLLETLNMQKR